MYKLQKKEKEVMAEIIFEIFQQILKIFQKIHLYSTVLLLVHILHFEKSLIFEM